MVAAIDCCSHTTHGWTWLVVLGCNVVGPYYFIMSFFFLHSLKIMSFI